MDAEKNTEPDLPDSVFCFRGAALGGDLVLERTSLSAVLSPFRTRDIFQNRQFLSKRYDFNGFNYGEELPACAISLHFFGEEISNVGFVSWRGLCK